MLKALTNLINLKGYEKKINKKTQNTTSAFRNQNRM